MAFSGVIPTYNRAGLPPATPPEAHAVTAGATDRSISIVICTANRADDLAVALAHISRLDRPSGLELEVIVVDNASKDHTQDVIEAARANAPFPIRSVIEHERGLGAARNCALRHARGDIIAWTDDDCIVDDNWLLRIVAHFAADEALDILGGRIELFDKRHLLLTVKTSLVPEVMDGSSFPGAILLGCNMVFRRRIVARVGGFDARFGAGGLLRAGEDAEFILRAYNAGCRVVYVPDVVVFHNHKRTTRQQALALKRNYHFSDGAFLAKHALQGDGGAARFFYWRLRHLLAALMPKPFLLEVAWEHLVFLLSFLAGAALYFRHMVKPSGIDAAQRRASRHFEPST